MDGSALIARGTVEKLRWRSTRIYSFRQIVSDILLCVSRQPYITFYPVMDDTEK